MKSKQKHPPEATAKNRRCVAGANRYTGRKRAVNAPRDAGAGGGRNADREISLQRGISTLPRVHAYSRYPDPRRECGGRRPETQGKALISKDAKAKGKTTMSTLDDNLKKRMDECRDSELDPEMVSPMGAGSEELPYQNDAMPLIRQFKQTNMGKRPHSLNTNRGGRKSGE